MRLAVAAHGWAIDFRFCLATGKYLASIGGEDDNNLVIWDVESGMAICGSPASHDAALTCKWLNHSETTLVTGGIAQLRVWDFDPVNRKVRPTECNLGKEKRMFTSIAISLNDSSIFCGTKSGDVVKIDTLSKRLIKTGPRKRFMQVRTAPAMSAVSPLLLDVLRLLHPIAASCIRPFAAQA